MFLKALLEKFSWVKNSDKLQLYIAKPQWDNDYELLPVGDVKMEGNKLVFYPSRSEYEDDYVMQ